MVARPSIQSRKLILETTFSIKEDFSQNDATKWVVQELKRRSLKQLFKSVNSTIYERMVQSFYENLKYNCKRLGVIFSSIDDRDIEVTIADIAIALKCHAERPKAKEPWIVCPSLLSTEDIVSNMCEGQFVDKHKN
jgi:folylpolyglutamate synthase/dihydropteroate synthase